MPTKKSSVTGGKKTKPVAKGVAPKKSKTASATTKSAKTVKAAAKPQAKTTAKKTAVPPAEERLIKSEDDIAAKAPTDVREHFFHEHRAAAPAPGEVDIPHEYGDTRIVLLVRDTEWVFAYWEIADTIRNEHGIPRSGHDKRIIVRMYKIDGRNWPEEAAHYFYDIEVGSHTNNWYIRVPEPDSQWCAELGMYDKDGNYVCIVRSNIVHTPRDSMSTETDTDWMEIEQTYQKLYGLSGGFTLKELRGSEELLRHLQKQIHPILSGESPTSGGIFSGSWADAPSRAAAANDFWLQVHTELILYGATEPDATVTVQGRPVKLHPDGSFSLRFALPDGQQVLDVRATSNDGTMEHCIIPVVDKSTK
ncbi:MAG: DUF4912 domain-containing protein [Candidatus Sumerlaeota bacterium]|nr:DUF4912 domain-containing protein [Candidatus Sumerlaeota bacterium]